MPARRLKANPRIRANDWRDVTEVGKPRNGVGPVAHDAFNGFYPHSEEGFRIHHDDFKDRSDRAGRRHGGKRPNPLLWSEEAMLGVIADEPDQVTQALQHPLARINTRVSGGVNGGPFHFFNTGLFTRRRVDANTALVQQGYRETLASCAPPPRFFREEEWQQIDENIEGIVKYVDNIVFDDVVIGDTLLMLAVRLDKLRAAQRVVELGVDVLARNTRGESVVAMIDEAFDRSQKALGEVAQLALQASSHVMPDLTEEEEKRVAHAVELDERLGRINALATTMCGEFESRLVGLARIEQKAWRADIEGGGDDSSLGVSAAERRQLTQKPLFIEDLKVCRRLRDASEDGARAVLSADAMKLAERLHGADEAARKHALQAEEKRRFRSYDNKGDDASDEGKSSSSLSSAVFDQVNVEEWIGELDAAAGLVQSVWRGNRVRRAIHDLMCEAAALQIQHAARGFLGRKLAQRERESQSRSASGNGARGSLTNSEMRARAGTDDEPEPCDAGKPDEEGKFEERTHK